MDKKLVHIHTTEGSLNADLLRIFLESHGIQVLVSQESAGAAYGLTIGRLGIARFYVPADQEQEAKALLAALERGEFSLPEEENPPAENDEENLMEA